MKVKNKQEEQLKKLIKESVAEAFLQYPLKSNDSKEDVNLTRDQVKHQYHITFPTINKYVKQGILKSYRLGRRVLFKKSEVEEVLIKRTFK